MPALLQPNLPRLATEYQDSQSRRVREALTELDALWRQFGSRFDAGWSVIRPAVLAEVQAAQYDLAAAGAAFIPAAMEETGQRVKRDGVADPTSLIGVTGSGLDVGSEFDWTPVRAKQAVAEGKSATVAREVARQSLILTATTVLMDTARGGESIGMAVHGGSGWIRVVHGGACGRCVVLAGKWFKYNQGFLRHPRCHCTHMPASETLGGHWQTDPRAYFDSLSAPQQIKLMGSKANAQAVLDGADVGQVINVYRRSSGLSVAQQSPIKVVRGQKFTTEGTTRRGQAGQQQAGLRRNGPQQIRPTPETIAMRASSVEERQRLMRLYGYIVDNEAAARGRAVFAEARRRERNARRAARRADGLPPGRTPKGSSGVGGSGGKPPTGPIRSGAMDDGDDRIAAAASSIHYVAQMKAVVMSGEIVEAIETVGGQAARLGTNVKDLTSLTRKLRNADRLGDELKVNDAVRFTAVFEHDEYWDRSQALIEHLRDLGYGVPDRTGWFRKGSYQGMNLTLQERETGFEFEFELQFHTPASLRASDETHPWYEERREFDTPADRKRELARLIRLTYSQVPRPPDVPVLP